MSHYLPLSNNDLASLSAEARKSLVQIRNGNRSIGAGSIWHPDGLIITSAHVVGRGNITVTLSDNRTLPAEYLAYDTHLDLAALYIKADGIPFIPIGDSQTLLPGDVVIAVGHPLGLTNAATFGIVMGIGSDWPELPASGREWIGMDLALRPGNSGGPLIDSEGKLVGINTMLIGPNFGMAVPVHVVKRFLKESIGTSSKQASPALV